jgi:CRP-like cAMP-binding protein
MNSAVTDLAQLRALPLFADLDDDALRRVSELAVELDIPAGQVLVHAGDPGSGLFVILSGTAAIEARGEPLIEVGPGEFVGELALLVPEATRSARVRANTDVRCLAIFAEDFRELLADEPRIALAMLPVLAERLWRARALAD